MDEKWKQYLFAFVMSVMMPGTLLHMGGSRTEHLPLQTEPPESVETTAPEGSILTIPVYMPGGEVKMMELEDYIAGVVLAEMPASFAEEALKAQAVAARTYTARCFLMGGKHENAAVCTDSHCCQAFIDPADYLGAGGLEDNVEKVKNAVRSTSGVVLTYGGELIEAAYFSCSGGRTEDAVAVWGGAVPYLLSVDSPGEEQADHYRDRVFLSRDELERMLGRTLSGPSSGWLGPVVYTTGGGVATMVFAGQSYTGVELRLLLGLNSTAFSVEPGEGGIYVTTSGKGHRVGLSQWGANAMAQAGCGYETIVKHYYFGITIDKIENLL